MHRQLELLLILPAPRPILGQLKYSRIAITVKKAKANPRVHLHRQTTDSYN